MGRITFVYGSQTRNIFFRSRFMAIKNRRSRFKENPPFNPPRSKNYFSLPYCKTCKEIFTLSSRAQNIYDGIHLDMSHLIFSGQKSCNRISSSILHSFLHFSRAKDVINHPSKHQTKFLMAARESECHPCYSFMFKLNFYESFAFLSRGHSIFYPNPSPKDERFSNRWGGGGGGSNFFSKKPTKF